MALKINKTSAIFGVLIVVILSGALGYLIWRVNQPQPLASTDSEAAEGLCADADYVIDVNKVVCGDGCFKGSPVSLCPPTQTFSMDVPVAGKFTVKGIVGRGHCDENGKNCQCQDNEEFYIVIGGKKGKVAKDDHTGKSGCGETVVVQELGDFDLNVKTYSVSMVSAAPKCVNKGDYPANSVHLNKVCLYAVPICGDGTVNGTESCDPLATPTGCSSGNKCLDDCTCAAVAEGELDLTKRVAESCKEDGSAELTYTITVANYGGGVGYMSSLSDKLDDKVASLGLTPTDISNGGIYSSGSINWSFADEGTNVINGGETKIFTYKLALPKSNFGTYSNTVTLKYTSFEGGDVQEKTADATISVDCKEDIIVPQTGIFDTTLGRIGMGIALLVIGGVVYSIPNRMLIVNNGEKSYKYREGFEKRVANR